MTALLDYALYTVILTFTAILLGAFLRNKEWTLEGLQAGLSNRDHLPEATPLGARAQRMASNSIEAALLFLPLALIAHEAELDQQVLLGAQVFFWSRVAYTLVYLAGVVYLRSLIWGVAVAGMGLMVVEMV